MYRFPHQYFERCKEISPAVTYFDSSRWFSNRSAQSCDNATYSMSRLIILFCSRPLQLVLFDNEQMAERQDRRHYKCQTARQEADKI